MHVKETEKKHKKRHARVPSVYQIENCECGAACLSMVLQYYGRYVNMEELRYRCSVTRDGCDASDLVEAAGYYGLTCKGYRRQVADLRHMSMPCVIHWDFSHFAVLEKISRRFVWLNDPAYGRRKISIQEFSQHYTGIVLTFEKTARFEKSHNPRKTLPLIKRRFKSDAKTVLFMVLAGLLLIVPGLVLPQITQIFIDDILIGGEVSFFKALLFAFVFANVYKMFFSFFRDYVLARMKMKMSLFTNRDMLYKILRLPINFYEQRYAGELVGRTDNNNDVNNFLAGSFSTSIIDVIEAMIYIVLMVLYSPILSIIGLGGILINLLFSYITTKPLLNMSLKYNQDYGRNQGLLTAGFSVGASIKANGVEDEYAQSIMNSYAKTTSSDQKLGRAQQILAVVPDTVSKIVSTIILVYGAYLIINGECTTGTLTAFTMLLESLTDPVNQIISLIAGAQSMRANLARVEDIMEAEAEPRFFAVDADTVSNKLNGYVEVDHLNFGYGVNDAPIIKDFSFRCTPGSRIAIVGASGCGKSTLGKLLSGMVKPWSGEIRFDGRSIEDISQEELTQSFGVVHQDGMIFSGTVRDNITMWNKNYPLKDLTLAVADADAQALVASFPGGFDYELSEGGQNLSGGQRQKIEIARALIKNPSILLLDEATSALDAVTEQHIMDNLKRRDCTAIIIAHRLSTIKSCDLILVMEDGRVVESGTHEALLNKNGLYKKLVNC